jgi:alkylation response protein AidB-like acyl-CoA dehydrogenase
MTAAPAASGPSTATVTPFPAEPVALASLYRPLLAQFASRARTADETDTFVAPNLAALKEAGLLAAGVPVEFGGLGAELPALCEMIREIGRHCGSTALAFSMHTHQVAIPAWRWRHQQAAPVVPLLKRVAAERLTLLSSGGSDWIAGSGKAEPVEGGYRITGRKIFTSACLVGDLLMTGAVLEGPDGKAEVLHFGVPMTSDKVRIEETWRTMTMRGTGSHDVVIDGHVIPEGAVALRRPQGEWHMLFHITAMIAMPLIYAAYLGVAEAARDRAVAMAGRRRPSHAVIDLVGRMDTELEGARFAHAGMLAACGVPGPETTNRVMMGRALLARHALAAVELAMESAGGGAIYRDNELERSFRDIQGARYHPMQTGQQQAFAGHVALGLDISRVF